MGNVRRLDESDYYYRMLAMLFNFASEVAVVNYPKNPNRRSLDAVAVLKDGRRVFIKITYDAANVSRAEASELVSMARVLKAAPLIVAECIEGVKLAEGVAYERYGVRVISSKTFSDVVSGRSSIYVYQSKDIFKVSIDSKKMKMIRLDKGLSLGDVAYVIGATRKTIYEYEKGSIEPTVDKAEKLVNILGDEILKPLDIFEPPKPSREARLRVDVDVDEERMIVEILKNYGYNVFHARRTSIDIGGSISDDKVVFIVHHKRERESRVLERAINAEKISQLSDSKNYIVAADSVIARELEKHGFTVVGPREVEDIVKRRREMPTGEQQE